MLPQTERYLDLARQGKNQWWRYALGALIIAGSWLVLGSLPYIYLADAGLSDPLFDYIAVNLSIFAMLGGLAVTVKLLHRRPLMGLITAEARIDWRRVAHGAAVWGVIAAAIVVAGRQARRRPGKRADCVLRYRPEVPLAVVEAKPTWATPGDGLQ